MSRQPFATKDDLRLLWRPLKAAEQDRAEALLMVASDELRVKASRCQKNLDQLCDSDEAYRNVVKSVVVDVVARTLMTSTDAEPMIQASETAGPYTWSGTFLVPGGGLFIKKSELARLGIGQQTIGTIEWYRDE